LNDDSFKMYLLYKNTILSGNILQLAQLEC
jgi:hypothetical protein